MARILVPTDFSDTARNAVNYALQMAKELPATEIILFNSFDKVVAGSDGTPLASDPDTHRNLSVLALRNLVKELDAETSVNVTTRAEEGSLISNIQALAEQGTIDLVVMGINGATRMEQIMIGSSTLSVISNTGIPVLVIPPDATYKGVRTVVFASDMKNVRDTTPAKSLRRILEIFRPTVHVVNVDTEHYVELTEEYKAEKASMDLILDGFNRTYAFMRLYDFTEAINQYALDHGADMIITVPRKHNFLSRLFTTSHTEKLAYHTHIPLLAIHD